MMKLTRGSKATATLPCDHMNESER
jgi:hypothetical protein